MTAFYKENSPYKKRARLAATGWTLLIFVLCLWPGNELPDVQIPLIDKWVHFVFFGAFSFLWLCGYPGSTLKTSLYVLIASIATGWLVELLQGQLTFLHRSQDAMDALADSIGGLLGIVAYRIIAILGK